MVAPPGDHRHCEAARRALLPEQPPRVVPLPGGIVLQIEIRFPAHLQPQVEPAQILVVWVLIAHDPRDHAPFHVTLSCPLRAVRRDEPVCRRVDIEQIVVRRREHDRLCVVLLVPEPPRRVIDQQFVCSGTVFHRDVVFPPVPAGDRLAVPLVAQLRAHRHRHRPVIGADLRPPLVVEHLVHHAQTSPAALLHAAARRVRHPVRPRAGDADPVQHIFLEERRVALIVHRARPRAV